MDPAGGPGVPRYTLITLVGLLLAFGANHWFGTRLHRRGAFWLFLGLAVLATAVFDNAIFRLPVVLFRRSSTLGVTLPFMPLEDVGFGVAMATFAVVFWEWLGQRATAPQARPAQGVAAALLRSSRPISWPNTFFVYAAGLLVAGWHLDLSAVAGLVYFTLPYNLLLYGVNDVCDYASDVRNPRKNSVEGGLLPPALHRPLWTAVLATNLPFWALWIALAPAGANLVLLALVALALAYSHPPARWKTVPFLDGIVSASHFVLPLICALAVEGLSPAHWPWADIVAFTLWGMASQAFGAIQDVDFDRQAADRSVATAIGGRATAIYALGLYLLAFALVAAGGHGPWHWVAAGLLLAYPLNVGSFLAFPPGRGGGDGHGGFARFLWINLAVGFVYTFGFLFVYHPFGGVFGR